MLKFTPGQILQINIENKQQSQKLSPVPKSNWPQKPASGPFPYEALRNQKYLVQLYKEQGGIIRLSINSNEIDPRTQYFRDGLTWDELQAVKDEAGFADQWAVEIYPADESVVNVANMRHLWILPEAPEFVWKNDKS